MYPPISDRIFRCLDASLTSPRTAWPPEILSDLIKAWVDPQTDWPPLSPDDGNG